MQTRCRISQDAVADPIELRRPGAHAHAISPGGSPLALPPATAAQGLASSDTSVETLTAILKEIYLEITMYQPDAIVAAVAAIAQFPRTMPVAWFDSMLHHQVEEFDHGEMAMRDYVALGGSEAEARARPQSPSAFAVAAVWRNITHKRDPFAYIGAVYLFEALTPAITTKARTLLADRLATTKGLEFIVHHATADIEHEEQISQLIHDVVERYPQKIESIVYGFEYFAWVYPLPVWNAAMQRAVGDVRRRSAVGAHRQAA